VTENARDAGPGQTPGPVREHVVIRDKRKIDPSGRPRTPDAGDATPPAADKAAEDAKPEVVESTESEAAKSDIVDAEVVAGEVVSDHATAGTATAGTATAGTATAGTATAGTVPAGFAAELESLRSELDERVRDLQRVTAEYANYRKRVDRDRAAVVEQAIGMVAMSLLPILDDLDRAREHDDLVGPSAAMAEQLSAALAKYGLTAFGEPGDAFDPTRHEAVAHQTSADVTEPTCVAVMRRGYLLGDRLLRAALVAVADPE